MTLFKRNICLWLIVILLVYPLSAQVKLFTNDELPSEHVYQISQDHTGYIWILTEEGMVKYNGNKLKLFSRKNGLPTNTIWNLVETEDRLWYICKGNKQGYIKDDSVYTFTHKTSSFTSTDHFIKNNQLILKDVNENLCLSPSGITVT